MTYLHIESSTYLTIRSAGGRFSQLHPLKWIYCRYYSEDKCLWRQDTAACRVWVRNILTDRLPDYLATLAEYWRWRCQILWNPSTAKRGNIAYAGASVSTTLCFALLFHTYRPVSANYRIAHKWIVTHNVDIPYSSMLYAPITTSMTNALYELVSTVLFPRYS